MSAASGNTAFFYRGRSDRRVWGRRMREDIRPSRYEAEQMFRRRTRAVEGVRCQELAQSSGMLIELIMFSAVVMVGIALLVSDSIERVYSIPRSMKVAVRTHHTTRYVPGLAPSIPVGLIPTDIEVARALQTSYGQITRIGECIEDS